VQEKNQNRRKENLNRQSSGSQTQIKISNCYWVYRSCYITAFILKLNHDSQWTRSDKLTFNMTFFRALPQVPKAPISRIMPASRPFPRHVKLCHKAAIKRAGVLEDQRIILNNERSDMTGTLDSITATSVGDILEMVGLAVTCHK
jgi:hypothetical protein